MIKGLPREAKPTELVALDIEMFGMDKARLHRPSGTFACLSIAYSKRESYQVTDVHDIKDALERIKNGTWCLHNAPFDLRILSEITDIRRRPIHDTLLFERNMFGGYYDSFGLDHLSRRWLNRVLDKGIRPEFEQATRLNNKLSKYAIEDAVATVEIAKLQLATVKEDDLDMSSYYDVDGPMIWVVLNMLPIKVDVEKWRAAIPEYQEKADQLEEQLGINSKSPQQALRAIKKETGVTIKSTGAGELKALRRELDGRGKSVQFVDMLIQARRYRDLVSKYGYGWLEVVEEDGLIYPSWNITGAETGRMSCSSPNMQQIPQRNNPEYRKLFIPDNDTLIVSDVAQQEPCIMAYMSRDPELIRALESGEDIHLSVAKTIYNNQKLTKKRNPDERFHGKTINLGSSYGLSEYGLAYQLGISETQAKIFLDNYFKRFRGVRTFIERERAMGSKFGYVRTSLGRRVYVNPHNRQWRNNCINAPIQGSAAEMTKLMMVNLLDICSLEQIPFPVAYAVHDEVVADVKDEYFDISKRAVDSAWQAAGSRVMPGIPTKVDVVCGTDWGCKSE